MQEASPPLMETPLRPHLKGNSVGLPGGSCHARQRQFSSGPTPAPLFASRSVTRLKSQQTPKYNIQSGTHGRFAQLQKNLSFLIHTDRIWGPSVGMDVWCHFPRIQDSWVQESKDGGRRGPITITPNDPPGMSDPCPQGWTLCWPRGLSSQETMLPPAATTYEAEARFSLHIFFLAYVRVHMLDYLFPYISSLAANLCNRDRLIYLCWNVQGTSRCLTINWQQIPTELLRGMYSIHLSGVFKSCFSNPFQIAFQRKQTS